MAKLYRLTIKCGEMFYCIGDNPTEVQEGLEKLLATDEDAISDRIKVTNIGLLAESPHRFPKDLPQFSGDGKDLIIINDWQDILEPKKEIIIDLCGGH
jgi:hypothetical protein